MKLVLLEDRKPRSRKEEKQRKLLQSKKKAFTLASEIEIVIESRILDSKVKLTLKELLGIAKKEFHEVIIDAIRRKRQVTEETRGVKAIKIQENVDMEAALLAGVRGANKDIN